VVTRYRPRSVRLLLAVLISLCVAVISLDYRQGASGPLAGLGRETKTAMVPLQRSVTAVTRPIGNFFGGVVHLPSLAQENSDLQRQLEALQAQVQRTAFDEQQLKTLQGLLGLGQSLNSPSVAARVIANGISNFAWSVTIDKGSKAGLAVDMPVVAGTAAAPMLVGRVVAVTPVSSEVMLIIDRSSAVAGKLIVSGATGLVEGEGSGDMKMTLVDAGTQVQGDEQVFTQGYIVNGQPGLYPPGLLIGQVSRSVPATNDLQAFITIRPAVDFSNLDFVLVLKSSGGGTR
jgi:rod shape-determining protein MreC